MFVLFFLFGQVVYNEELYLSFGFSKVEPFIGLVLFSMIYTPVSFILGQISVRMSRRFEF
jgi:hypothetical protein